MPSREECVQKLKSQIDPWNAQARDWEAKARDAAMGELRRLQGASADAWQE